MPRENYAPRAETAAMLDRAWEIMQSVPYAVGARWLFYRVLQEGFYAAKSDYKDKFIKVTSAARHAGYKEWRPDSLADETREAIIRGNGWACVEDWLKAVQAGLSCELDHWESQPYYIELWYEARAMTQQFEYYTEHIVLRPLGGQPSIDYKYKIAKALEDHADKEIIILYFGDLDTAGELISEVVERDVRKWCDADFEFIRCGLTLAQAQLYNVPENPEKPGEYQWEALPDEGAREIITTVTSPYLRHDAFADVATQEADATAWLRGHLAGLRWPN